MPRYPKIACVKYETKQRETEKKTFALIGARTDSRLSARTTLNGIETELKGNVCQESLKSFALKKISFTNQTIN